MNKDRVNGMIDEVAGSAKRKAGELTDNPKLQVEGMVQQAKGKVEGAWGKAKRRPIMQPYAAMYMSMRT